MPNNHATVIGGGLAGCEAAFQLARRGVKVTLVEMKPQKRSPAHHSDALSELVCSNSLRGAAISTAPGLLKQEMRAVGSIIIEAADACAVAAGGALAVDRDAFSAYVTEKISNHPNITVQHIEQTTVPQGAVIIATGPLTEGAMAQEIERLTGQSLHFYDAAAPIVSADSIDMSKAYFASRYGKGTPDYINCPMDKEQYLSFHSELREAKEAPVHGFEDSAVFEGCMPVEVMARRGVDTLRYGPLKPVGLEHPQTGERPYAVVQLRAENESKTAFNLVGFQTHLLHGEQKRVFSMIPGLENAEFYRYGVMHRNSYINSPGKLSTNYKFDGEDNLYFAGQMTGVEGYIESAASGMCAGIDLARRLLGQQSIIFPECTALGALGLYVSTYGGKNFQPSNINFGLLPPMPERIKDKKMRYTAVAQRALDTIEQMLPEIMQGVDCL